MLNMEDLVPYTEVCSLEEMLSEDVAQTEGGNEEFRSDSFDQALSACLRIKRKDGKDGSRRLFAICCRGIEHDLNPDQIVALVRQVECERPFPKAYSDSDICERIASAELKCQRGAALSVRPRVDVTTIDLAALNKEIWSIVNDKNVPPILYRYGGQPSRIELDDKDQPFIRAATFDVVRHHLAKWIYYFRFNSDGRAYPVAPPQDVVRDLLATVNMPLPKLTRIVGAPVYARNGTLLTEPGYHPEARTYYVPSANFKLQTISDRPTQEEVTTAKELILKGMLGDFPFTGDAELAHAVALLLLPFVQAMIDGATPFHLIEKPSPGTGASLLANCLHYIATGRDIAIMTEGRDEEEWRKRITAKLRGGPQYIMIDNIRLPLESAAVAAALTAEEWEDRVLGTSQVVRIPIQCVWLGTGNNPVLSDEIARRTIRIRLDAKCDRPWLRDIFLHDDLRSWVIEHRSELVHACLTLIQAWIAAGKPEGEKRLGMYESWSKIMGGILEVAEIPGLLGNLNEFYAQSDAAGAVWRGFLVTWHDKHANKEVKVADLFPLALEAELPLGTGSERSQRTKLGKMLSENRERVFDLEAGSGRTVVRLDRGGKHRGDQTWHLTPVSFSVAV
jgi:hypothetical protein